MDNVMILQATEADIPSIQAVAAESWQATYGHIFTPTFITDYLAAAYSAENLRRSLQSTRSIFLIAKADEQVVGYCQLGLGGQGRHENGSELYRIYLLPSYWGQGIGTHLLQQAEAWLRTQGETGYFCHVHGQNAVGKAFYLKAGFVHDSTGDAEGEWCMRKVLT